MDAVDSVVPRLLLSLFDAAPAAHDPEALAGAVWAGALSSTSSCSSSSMAAFWKRTPCAVAEEVEAFSGEPQPPRVAGAPEEAGDAGDRSGQVSWMAGDTLPPSLEALKVLPCDGRKAT